MPFKAEQMDQTTQAAVDGPWAVSVAHQPAAAAITKEKIAIWCAPM
jgi:hypothetical protein